MDAEKALELMEKDIKTVDSKTATLYGFAIDAMKKVNEKPPVRLQLEHIGRRVCYEICKYHEEYAKLRTYEADDELSEHCKHCPLEELI